MAGLESLGRDTVEAFASGVAVADLAFALGTARWGVVVDGVPVVIYPGPDGVLRLRRQLGDAWVELVDTTVHPFSATVSTPCLAVQPGTRRVVAAWRDMDARTLRVVDWPDLLEHPESYGTSELSAFRSAPLAELAFPSVDVSAAGTTVLAFQARIVPSYVPARDDDPTWLRVHWAVWGPRRLPDDDDVRRVYDPADDDDGYGSDTPTVAISDDPSSADHALVVIAWRYITVPADPSEGYGVKDIHYLAGSVAAVRESPGWGPGPVTRFGFGALASGWVPGAMVSLGGLNVGAVSTGSPPTLPGSKAPNLQGLPSVLVLRPEGAGSTSWTDLESAPVRTLNPVAGAARDPGAWSTQDGRFWVGYTNYGYGFPYHVSIDVGYADHTGAGTLGTPAPVSDGLWDGDPEGFDGINNFVNGFALAEAGWSSMLAVCAWENGPVLAPGAEQSRTIELNVAEGGSGVDWGDASTWSNPLDVGPEVGLMAQYPSTFLTRTAEGGVTLYVFWVRGQSALGAGEDGEDPAFYEPPTVHLDRWRLT